MKAGDVMWINRCRTAATILLGLILTGTAIWIWWSESHPGRERELRIMASERLHEWFPEEMALPG
ncbi:MAG TPA: hypothetical protein VLL97_01855, partial [Acidobacteriota bacterium]|nr:hypothetical protein [Acidobacteriota bacterium]